MTYAEALAELTKGCPGDQFTDKLTNRIGAVAECLTDRDVTPALRAKLVGILRDAQQKAALAVFDHRRPRTMVSEAGVR